jgi:hypothetical protein
MLIHQYGPRSLSVRNQVRHKSGGVSPGAAAFLGGVAFGCVSFVLPQRFAAAFLAVSTRRSGGIRSARARPPLRPSSWVSASPGSAMFSSNTPGAPELSANWPSATASLVAMFGGLERPSTECVQTRAWALFVECFELSMGDCFNACQSNAVKASRLVASTSHSLVSG